MGSDGRVDLRELAARLANRALRGRTEATVQSDIRMLLIAARLNLTEHDVLDVKLEAHLGDRRRIDIEMGRTVIEVKRSLTAVGSVREAAEQLSGYVQARSRNLGHRYTGIVTDGRDWHLFHQTRDRLVKIAEHQVRKTDPDVEALIAWLASVLTTEERVMPTKAEVANRLGASSPGHGLERATLCSIYQANRNDPKIAIKRELWAKLLTTALGTQFTDNEEELFVDHTLLVVTAECVAHAVLQYRISQLDPESLLRGDLFAVQSQIHGVVEQDFFDWPLDCSEPGREWVLSLARRIDQFDWSQVDYDAMKTIYESVIPADTRRRLGEYYTPDFLAEAIVEKSVGDPLTDLVMDPSCGSGTFLFHAVRRYLAASDQAGIPNGEAVSRVTDHIFGVDVHPVAVTLARVTYLLAIGAKRLAASDRGPLRIPVFLGDALQWGQRDDLFASATLNVSTGDAADLFADQLRFPQRLLDDADAFDSFVAELAERASNRERGSMFPPISDLAALYGLSDTEIEIVQATFDTMCGLHDQNRNHIWSYYVRNLARPAWLARKGNQRTVLVGNPPWLAYRFMTDSMKDSFAAMSKERNLWSGKDVATNQDLADLFVARSIEQYLSLGGCFAFIMPAGVLAGGQSEGFRAGDFRVSSSNTTQVEFDTPWNLSPISHRFFPRTACVVFGTRSERHGPLPETAEKWVGRLPNPSASWSEVRKAIERHPEDRSIAGDGDGSPYEGRFANGANLYPRVLIVVEESKAPPLGAGAGRVPVRSSRSNNENRPWDSLPDLHGVIESQFVHPVLFGASVMPYWQRPPLLAVLPLKSGKIMTDVEMNNHEGLRHWWLNARKLWDKNQPRSMALDVSINSRRKLTSQFPLAPHRVVYGRSGMHVTACRITNPDVIVEHQLNWAVVESADEARYLCSVLNSVAVTKAVEPFMVPGKGGGRHIGSHLWKLPIPAYDSSDALHRNLATLGAQAEHFVEGFQLKPMEAHGRMRGILREALAATAIGQTIEEAVSELLSM